MEFIKTQPYIKALKKLKISKNEENQLYEALRKIPKKGDVVSGGGGIRKIRVALGNRGKSAGARVIYFYLEIKGRIYLLTAYAKNEQANLTKSETAKLKEIATLIKKASEQ